VVCRFVVVVVAATAAAAAGAGERDRESERETERQISVLGRFVCKTKLQESCSKAEGRKKQQEEGGREVEGTQAEGDDGLAAAGGRRERDLWTAS
jgi:hypothetical protein